MKIKTEVITVRVPQELKTKAQKYALENKTDLSKIVNQLLKEFIK